MQFMRRFHNAKFAISSDSRAHAAGHREHELCAGKALQCEWRLDRLPVPPTGRQKSDPTFPESQSLRMHF